MRNADQFSSSCPRGKEKTFLFYFTPVPPAVTCFAMVLGDTVSGGIQIELQMLSFYDACYMTPGAHD